MTLSLHETDELQALLGREEQIYAGLRELSRRQMDIIEADAGTEKLLDVLGRKQVLLNQVEDVERELARYKKTWSTDRERLEPDLRDRIESRVQSVQNVLAEVLKLEEQSQQRLMHMQRELGRNIRQIARGRQAHNAYGPRGQASQGGGRIDNQG